GVRSAVGQTADDLIEALLAAESRPGEITVVSNDSRLHEAARRRGSRAWSCQHFMDWLAEPDRPPDGGGQPRRSPAPPADEKPAGPTADEAAELARAFGAKPPPPG